MPTSLAALLLSSALCATPAWLGRLTAGLGAEVNVIGLSLGPRLELAYRPFEPLSASRIRVAVAVDPGPEFVYLPVALGYRAVFRQDKTVRPLLGAGLELQQFLISDAPTERRLSTYWEAGLLLGFAGRWETGPLASFENGFGFKPGLSLRWMVTFTP